MSKLMKESEFKAKQLAKAREDANRKVNLTYLIAGAYVQSLEIATKAMDWSSLELIHRDKKLTKEIAQLSKRLMYLIDELQKGSVLSMSEEDSMVHEDTLHMFFALFMAIIDRAGTDEFSDLRLYNLYNIITSYKSLVKFDFLKIKDNMAFFGLRDKIENDPTIEVDSKGNITVTIKDKCTDKIMKKQILQVK